MKNKKILLSLLLAFVLVFAACSNDDTKTDLETNEPAQTDSLEEKEDEKEEELEEDNEDEEDEMEDEAESNIPGFKDEVVREVFIDAEDAKELIDENKENFIIVEATWGEAADSPDYLQKHLPGAIHMNTDIIEEGPVWNFRSPEEMVKAFVDNGIDKDTTILFYGPDTAAHRYALAALYLGNEDVKVLDGGLKAWEAEGYETEEGEVKPYPKTEYGLEAPLHPEYVLSLDEVVDKLDNDPNFQLISNRSEEEWKGEESGYSYIPKAGEPLGAKWGRSGIGNSGMEYYQKEDGTNKPFEEIAKMWMDDGISLEKEMSFYCGTGWRAALPFLMAYERGYEPTLFDGGWNEWQMHDELKVQVGAPGEEGYHETTVGELETGKESVY